MVRELGIEWFEPYSQVLDASRGVEWARWFTGGKLNIAWNCLDRHASGAARDRLAIIWEGEDGSIRTLTFGELRRETDRLANALRGLGLAPETAWRCICPWFRKSSSFCMHASSWG
jgi:acetyl-CoA synthetase